MVWIVYADDTRAKLMDHGSVVCEIAVTKDCFLVIAFGNMARYDLSRFKTWDAKIAIATKTMMDTLEKIKFAIADAGRA